MPTATVNGVKIHYEATGEGDPMVLVHGGLGSYPWMDPIAPRLAGSFRVISYDRRGHGRSELPDGQMKVHEHVADLAALIEELGPAPAWVVGNSAGACVVLRLAGERPDLLRGLTVHEPPLFQWLVQDPATAPLGAASVNAIGSMAQRIASGDHAGAAEELLEAMVGPGSWAKLPARLQQESTANAPKAPRDDVQGVLNCDPDRLRKFARPALLTLGDESPPWFAPIVEKVAALLPHAEVVTVRGAGHIPQVTHPEMYAETILEFTRKHAAQSV
jgi:pimeloyl-ACP methyl ester carboxylesterase